jgi:hypothetical protein
MCNLHWWMSGLTSTNDLGLCNQVFRKHWWMLVDVVAFAPYICKIFIYTCIDKR